MLDWPLYIPSPNRECLYKVTNPGKIPEGNTIYIRLVILYPFPNKECFYKMTNPGKIPEKT